jgi:hypothetical protein
MNEKPSLFIGSSSEGENIANDVFMQLDKDADITMWYDDEIFELGQGSLDSIIKSLDKFDFAVFILTPDDPIESRGQASWSPRDNVLFEFGLFAGHLGIGRTFVIYNKNATIKIPSDWSGVTFAQYEGAEKDKNSSKQIRSATLKIGKAIREKGIRKKHSPKPSTQSLVREIREDITKLDTDIQHISSLIRSEKGTLDSIYNYRATHYKTEKRVIAEPFLEDLLGERIKYLRQKMGNRGIRIIFDSGTTIAPILDVLGRKAEEDHTHWCKKIPIITNNIKGIENMLKYREYPTNPYSELTIQDFSVLPGKVLAPFEAIADETTLKALQTFYNDDIYTIAITTGNYILVHKNQFVVIARGGFHPNFKATLYDIADEVYVVAPLGKSIMWTDEDDEEGSKIESLKDLMDQLNSDLNFTISSGDELNEKEKYQIVTEKLVRPDQVEEPNITKWLAKSVLVTTSRSKDCLFYQHYQSLKLHQIRHRCKGNWEIGTGPFFWDVPFKGLPLSKEDHFKIEIPHENMQNLARKYFFLPDDFTVDK